MISTTKSILSFKPRRSTRLPASPPSSIKASPRDPPPTFLECPSFRRTRLSSHRIKRLRNTHPQRLSQDGDTNRHRCPPHKRSSHQSRRDHPIPNTHRGCRRTHIRLPYDHASAPTGSPIPPSQQRCTRKRLHNKPPLRICRRTLPKLPLTRRISAPP